MDTPFYSPPLNVYGILFSAPLAHCLVFFLQTATLTTVCNVTVIDVVDVDCGVYRVLYHLFIVIASVSELSVFMCVFCVSELKRTFWHYFTDLMCM